MIEMLLDHIALFNFYEGIYLQKRQGALNKDIWETWDRSLAKTMRNPEIRQTWESVKTVYSQRFVAHVGKTDLQADNAS